MKICFTRFCTQNCGFADYHPVPGTTLMPNAQTESKLNLLLLCQMRDTYSKGNAMAPDRHNTLPWKLGLPDKGCAIKGLVVCYVVWLGSMIYGMGLWTRESCKGLIPCCGQNGYRAQVPQHPLDTYLIPYDLLSQYID